MEILELLDLVNIGLEQGETLTGIAKKLGVNESTIRKRLNKQGYKRINNKFILQSIEEVGQQVGQIVGQQIKEPVKAIVGHKKDIVGQNQKKLIDIISNYDILMNIIEQYQKQDTIYTNTIEIRLPYEENKGYKASLRINETVLNDFKIFCSKHKNFTQKDLLSMALVEYMNKYK